MKNSSRERPDRQRSCSEGGICYFEKEKAKFNNKRKGTSGKEKLPIGSTGKYRRERETI